jgi:hypothetical protein
MGWSLGPKDAAWYRAVSAVEARLQPSRPTGGETVRLHTIYGFLADPRYGGNRGFAGWKLMGYPGPRHGLGGYTPQQMLGEARIKTVWGEKLQRASPRRGSLGGRPPGSARLRAVG